MNCEKAEVLMMKHMDNNITQQEKVKLDKHLQGCIKCMNDFQLYNVITTELMITYEAPEMFTENVMAKIEILDTQSQLGKVTIHNKKLDTIVFWIFLPVVSSTVLLAYSGHAVNALYENSYLAEQMQVLAPVAESIVKFTDSISYTISEGLGVVGAYSTFISISLLAAIVLMVFMQIYSTRQSTKSNEWKISK